MVAEDGRLGTVQPRAVFSRRALLGLAALSVAGCGKHTKQIVPKPAIAPDAAALVTARNGERLLLASYDAKIAHASARELPPLQVARAIHATHLSALHGTTSSDAGIAVVAKLRHALRSSARDLRSLAFAAQSGANAALFASIAASHEASAG
jgi:hypothetical protein